MRLPWFVKSLQDIQFHVEQMRDILSAEPYLVTFDLTTNYDLWFEVSHVNPS